MLPDHIPGELHREILALLSVQHVLPLRLVCKDWKSIIDDLVVPGQFLIRSRTGKLYTLPLQSLSFDDDSSASEDTPEEKQVDATIIKNNVGPGINRVRELPYPSCHGLILIKSRKNKEWVICDPFHAGVYTIPPYTGFASTENVPKSDCLSTAFYGIGYDSFTSDYKVVRIACIFAAKRTDDNFLFKTLIYSLKSRTWHRIEGFPCDKGYPQPFPRCLPKGVFMNGALHWIVKGKDNKFIVSLDLTSESYHTLPLPSDIKHHNYDYLDAHGGNLFLSSGDPYIRSCEGKRVWILKDYGGVNKWTLLISLKHEQIPTRLFLTVRPVAYIKSKEQVIIHYGGDKLMWFDVEKKKCLHRVTLKGFEDGGFSCQQLAPRHTWLNGNIVGADESVNLNRTPKGKRKRKTSDVALEISACKRPRHWVA